MELPDIWLTNGNPWELKRPGIKYPVGFYGSVVGGKWQPEEKARSGTPHHALRVLPTAYCISHDLAHVCKLSRVSLCCSDELH